MHHIKTLGIKLLITAFTIYTIYGIFANTGWLRLLGISLAVTGISYLIGDMLILRKFGNLTATISDFVLVFMFLFILGGLFLGPNVPLMTTSILSAFFIACSEPFVHGYVINQFSADAFKRLDWSPIRKLQTEFAEETDKSDLKSEKNKTE